VLVPVLDEDLVHRLRTRPVAGGVRCWEYDVYLTTHDRLQRGEPQAGRCRVELLATNHLEAQRLAVAMVLCMGYYVTGADYLGDAVLGDVQDEGLRVV
jgi:hypothetical protein